MSDTTISSAAFADTKPHYELLDGLRGVAALLVVFYHIFEGLSFAAFIFDFNEVITLSEISLFSAVAFCIDLES